MTVKRRELASVENADPGQDPAWADRDCQGETEGSRVTPPFAGWYSSPYQVLRLLGCHWAGNQPPRRAGDRASTLLICSAQPPEDKASPHANPLQPPH